jgi:hypothetical protein
MSREPVLIDNIVTHHVEINEGVRKSFQNIACTHPECESTLSFAVTHTLKPASVIMNIAKKKGWTISGNRYKNRICPNHKVHIQEKTMSEQINNPSAAKLPPLVPSTNIPTEAARLQRRKVFFEISEVYATKAYNPGFSDQTIATKLKVPVNVVRLVREENFGPAGHDENTQEIRKAIKVFEDKLNALDANLMSLLSDAESKFQAMRRDLASLTDKLNKLEEIL